MYAVLLGFEQIQTVEIGRKNPGNDISRLVGDPLFDCMRHITGVDFWVGDSSLLTRPLNQLATWFFDTLLQDVRSGDYATSDSDRAHVSSLLDHSDWMPVIHGPSLITGVNDIGDTVPLGENSGIGSTNLSSESPLSATRQPATRLPACWVSPPTGSTTSSSSAPDTTRAACPAAPTPLTRRAVRSGRCVTRVSVDTARTPTDPVPQHVGPK